MDWKHVLHSAGYPGSPHAHDPTYGVPPEPTETAPAGCDKDTFKLYVNNIPRGWETEDMRPLIETYGTVRVAYPNIMQHVCCIPCT